MAQEGRAPQTADTFPRLLLWHARVRPNHPALREKDLGVWQTWTWSQLAAEVRVLAAALHRLGLARGGHVAIIGENRPRLYAAMLATQSLGAVPVPMYQDATAAQMVYVFEDAQIEFAIVEGQEQVDKVLEVREQYPALAHIVFEDPRGLRNYDQPGLVSYDELRRRGAEFAATRPGFFDEQIARGAGSDTAALFYTSGTTGRPKGVVQTHAALIDRARVATEFDRLGPDEDVLAYLPLAWIGQNIFSYAQALFTGYTVNCPESPSTVSNDMREIGPTYYFAPPRVFEGMLTQVMIRMEDAGRIKRALFHHFMEVGRHVGGRILDRKPVGAAMRLWYALGDVLVYGPLRNQLGLSRVKVAYTAGEAIGPDLFSFYRSLGVNLKQLYGSTETAVFVCMQPDGQVRADSVGPPVAGVELRIADNGEVLVRSPGLLKEYHRNPQATAEVRDAEGWFHTGDAGLLDADGHLRIIDRAADVGHLADGTLFAPKYIENKLKFFPQIKEAVAFGDGREQVCAFLNIDLEAVGNWAERRGLAYAGYVDLATKPEVLDLVAGCVDKVNADLAADPLLANSQIRRFLVLHKELDPDDDELTRTRKVRRRFIAQKYQVLVDALYGGRDSQYLETEVRFEDGRLGKVAATLALRTAKAFAPVARAA
ncbi:putative long-chain-fatty-acid--CoA ligase [Burkholderiales bacterium]|nr:putative long-chain-fatty-acid--CoA ligase [Burkholderiales bacterium]